MKVEHPLVSILVITYNSSRYILETLESCKDQTYKNIEIIISDDASVDNTVDLCENWLKENKNCFIFSTIVKANKNGGIPSNINKGLNFVKGEWVKVIAGDDVISHAGIENMVKATDEFAGVEILLTQIEVYKEAFDPQNLIAISPLNEQKPEVLNKTSSHEEQIKYLLQGFFFPAPGFFIKHSLIEKMGGYDERYTLIEDVPFFLKALFLGHKIYFKPVVTVKYRKHYNNLTSVRDKIFQTYYLQYCKALYNGSIKYGKFEYVSINLWNLYFVKIIFLLGNKGIFCEGLNKIRIYLNPRRIFSFLRKNKFIS